MKLYQRIATLLAAIENCEKSGNTVWLAKHWEALADIERDLLPHGSGFDAGCRILLDESNENKITIQADFHAMDENGYYCGWKEYKVVIRPNLTHGMALTVKGRDYNGLKDYIADTFHYVLDQEVTL